MPILQEIEVMTYTFDELSDEAKQKVGEWLNDDMGHILTETLDLASTEWGVIPEFLKVHDWSVGGRRDYVTLNGDIHIHTWLKSQKLANKYRSLYYWSDVYEVHTYVKDNIESKVHNQFNQQIEIIVVNINDEAERM